MALALANKQSCSRVEVVVQFVDAVRGPERILENPVEYFRRRREDPEWGWEPVSRWN